MQPPRSSAHLGLKLAASLGVGLIPGPHGTWGSLLTLAAAWVWLSAGGWPLAGAWYAGFLVVSTACAVWVSGACERAQVFGPRADPGQIVIDEAVGMLLALYGAAAPLAPERALAAFAAFRFFDVLKPWPIRASQRLPGGWGVVADDVLAGAAAWGVVELVGLWLPCW